MLAKPYRFHGHNSLKFVYRRGQTVRGQFFNTRYVFNKQTSNYRVAIVVSKKVSKSAVVRNRIRRRIYSVIEQQAIIDTYDIVVTVHTAGVATMPFSELQHHITQQLQHAGIVKK